MTDTTDVPQEPVAAPVPEAPAAPAPAPVETPAPEVPETPQEGAQAGSDGEEETTPVSSSDSTTSAPETSSGTSAEVEAPQEPEVVNDDNGQHVNMADGTTVYTRTHPYPVTNSEWEVYERTHSGDQARYALKPGDLGYNALSDPSVPNSWLAKQIEVQLSSFAERVKTDPNARPSVTWDALQPTYQGELSDAIATGGGSGKVEA